MNKIRKKIFLFSFLCIFVLTGLTACGEEGVKVNSANALARKLASDSAVKINVSKDIVLDEPIVVSGEKEIVGNGTVTIAAEGMNDAYMITVADGGKLTVGGSVKIDAVGLMGSIHVQEGGAAIVQDKAVVKNASEATANAFVEGSFEVKGGTLEASLGHNIYNKKETVISGGEIIGSGDKFAGVYNEGILTQNGGTISGAYNNVSNLSGSTFTFEGGTNTESIRDGIFVAEGATFKATKKEAQILEAGARGILLRGQADIKLITIKECGDSLIKVGKNGVLNLGNGILQEGNYHGVDNAGTMTMLGGTIQMNKNCGIVNTGTLKITSGNIANNENKGILNKHEGVADVTSAMVTFTSNKTAIANEDKAVFEFAKAKIMMSTQTNIYVYDGTMNIHDAALNASTSNNVRIIDGVINMTNVEVKGNSQSSGTSHHAVYMEGGVINAVDTTISMSTGHGIRNKGGVFKGKNIVMHDINRVAISQGKHDYLDVEGLTEIDGLEIQSTNYANIWNEGGGTVRITNGKLAVAGSNSIRVNDGLVELTNVTVPGHKEGSKDNIHGIYMEGGEIVAKNVTIKDTSGNALRNKNGKFTGTNIKMTNIKGQTAISNLPLDDDNKNGIINIDGLTIKNSLSKNITLDSGVTTIKNATLGATGGNNIKMQNNAAILNLYNVKIEGQHDEAVANTHGIMVEGGNVFGENIQMYNVEACGIRCKMGVVDLKNVTMTDIGQAAISNSKMVKDDVELGVGNVTIDGLTTSKVGTNNITMDAGKVTIKNGELCKIESKNHNVKTAGSGVVDLENVKIAGTTDDGRYGIIAEGGEAVLNNVEIYDLAKSGLHANRETSSIKGTNVTVKDAVYAITGSNGSITIDGLATTDISANNILADSKLKVTIKNSTGEKGLGETAGHNVKVTGDALVTLNNVEVKGVTGESKHGIMAEGGDVALKDVTISNVKNVDTSAIRINKVTSKVTGEKVAIKNCWHGVTGTNGKVTIDGLTTTDVTNNNVLADGQAKFTIKNADLCKVTGNAHNVKVAVNGQLTIKNSVINGTTSDSKYGIIVEGGEAELKNVEIYDVAKSAIHVNKDSSIVIGKNITIANGVYAITGSAGTIELEKVKTSDISENNITISDTCNVTILNSTGGYGLGETNGHNVKVTGDAVVTLDTVEVEGVTSSKHGIMAEGGDVNLNNVNIHDVNGSAIRINVPTSEVNAKKLVIKDSTNAVTGTAGTVVIDGLTTSGIVNNNVYAGPSGENVCEITIQNAKLGQTGGHNVKSDKNGRVTLENTEITGVLSSGKNGVMAENGYVKLKDVSIRNVIQYAIRCHTATSEVDATDVTIGNSGTGVSVGAGTVTINGLTSKATTTNVSVSGGKSTITNGTLAKTSSTNVVLSGGQLTFEEVDVNGTSAKYGIEVSGGKLEVKPEVTVKDTAAEGIYNHGGTIEGNTLTIKDTGATALHNTNGGKTTLENLTISGTKSAYNIWNEGDNSSVTVDGGDLGKSPSNNVVAAGGTVTLKNIDVNGTGGKASNNIHGVLASGGDVVLDNVGITGAATGAIRVNNAKSKVEGTNVTFETGYIGISASAGETVINGLTTSGLTQNNILASDSAKVTINSYADDKKSVLGTTKNSHNVKATPDALVTLNGVFIKGSTSSNAVMAEGGDFVLNNVDIEGAAKGTGIRINNTASLVQGTNVTINGCNMGISYKGNIDITGLTCNAITTNVEVAGGTFNIKDAAFGKTAGSNILVTGGTATLENATINGTSGTKEVYGIEVSGGTLNLKGDITVKDTSLEGIYNYGGTINGAEGKSVTIQNTGSTAIWNTSGATTTLKGVTISGVKAGHSIKNENADSTVVINGGEFAKTKANNVYAGNGTITLNNVTINGSANDSTHGILACGGDVELDTVTIKEAKNSGIRINNANSEITGKNVTITSSVNAIHMSPNGKVTIDGLTTSGMTNNNIRVGWDSKSTEPNESGEITINGYEDGKKSVLGETDGHNVVAYVGVVNLNNVQVNGTSAKGDKNGSSALFAHGGDLNLANVDITGANGGTGIRINRAASLVKGSDVTINECNYGISYNGNIDITGLTCNATTTNVEVAGGTFNIKDAAFGKTAGSNILVTGGTATLENATIQGGPTGIMASGGEIVVNGITTSGVTGNNILADKSGKVTVNAYSNGTKSVLEVAGGHNVKTLPDGLITLNDVEVKGTSSKKHHAVMAEGGDFVLNNVDIQGVPNGAGIRANKDTSTVKGTNISISNVKEGISNTKATFELENVTVSNITGNYEFYNAGTLKLAGAIDADIHNDITTTVEVTKALTGDVQFDWTEGAEPAIAIQFASEADLEASRDHISLGPVQSAKYEFEYVDTMAVFVAPILVTGDYDTLQEAVDAIAATEEKVGIIRVQNDLTITSTINIPEGSNVTIVDNGEKRTITRAEGNIDTTIFNVPANTTLTLISSSRNNEAPSLIIDGGSEDGVTNTSGCALIATSGTVKVGKGVALTNNESSGDRQGFGIYANTGSTTTFSGVISNIVGTNSNVKGNAFVVKGTFILKNAIVKDNVAVAGAPIRVQGGQLTVIDTIFTTNKSTGNGGAILVDRGSQLTVQGSKFEQNKAANGGAIYNQGTLQISNPTSSEMAIFADNTASNWGGAIYTTGGKLTVDGYKFATNKGKYGGAILMFTESAISNTTFQGNEATSNEGGAIYVNRKVEFIDCTFDGNIAKTNGGAICCAGNKITYTFTATDSSKAIFTNNVSNGKLGGAIYLYKGILTGSGYVFTNNSPEDICRNTYYADNANNLEGTYNEATCSKK